MEKNLDQQLLICFWNICYNLDSHLVMGILVKTIKQMSGGAAFMFKPMSGWPPARGGIFCHPLKHHIQFINLHSIEHVLWKEMCVPVTGGNPNPNIRTGDVVVDSTNSIVYPFWLSEQYLC